MGIYLPNMKMPTEGWHKVIKIFSDGTVVNNYDSVELGKAVHVPPHGRLIDADALMKEMDKQENAMFEHGHEFSFSFKSGGDVCTAWYNVEMMVEDAPTIIPTEEGENAD